MTCKIKRRSLRCGGRPKANFGSIFTTFIAPALGVAGSVADSAISKTQVSKSNTKPAVKETNTEVTNNNTSVENLPTIQVPTKEPISGLVTSNTIIPSDPTKTPTMRLGGRKKCWIGAAIGAATSIAGSLFGAASQKREMRRQKSIQDLQNTTQEAANMTTALNNSQDYQEDYLRQFRTAARLGKTLGVKGIYITDGGDATKIGNNTYLLRGGSHEDVNETGQTGIGINVGGNEVEAEGGEVAQKKNGALRIFSAQPILGNGMSPAQAILRGYNKDKVFNAQQTFKRRNGLKDDGSRLRNGGLTSKDRGSSKHPYPSVSSKDFAGGGRSYPIPTKADAVDALRLAGLHVGSDVRSKVYSKYPSLRKKSLLGSCSLPVKGMRPKATIGIFVPYNKRYTSIYDAPDYNSDYNGGNVLGNGEVTVTAKRIKPTFMKPNNDAMNIINHPANETPYIPQRHNRSRTIFSGGDYLGLGIDTLAALSTGLVNYNTAGKYVLPDRSPIIQASKLPTTYNVNPEIEEVKRYRDRLTGQTFNNTSSSVAALNRSGAINLDALSNLSKLWATKENEENKMLTEDAKNQQTVAAQNVQNELARQSEIARIKNEAIQAKGDALNVGLSGLSQAWTNFWTAGRTAYEDDQSRRAMIASSKDATPTRLMEMDFDLSPDILASLYRTAKDDRTKRFYLSRLSPKQRLKYGIN